MTSERLQFWVQWVVACYDGARWLAPTVEGWREQERRMGDAPEGPGRGLRGHCPALGGLI
jgi:hypothetical protein